MYSHQQFTYCPWCGTKFEGELKWEPDYDSPEREKRDLKFKHRRDADALTNYDWVVESKFIWNSDSQEQIEKKPWEMQYRDRSDCHVHGNLPSVEGKNNKEKELNHFRQLVAHERCDVDEYIGYAYRLVLYDRYWGHTYGGEKPILLAVCKEYYPKFEKKVLDK